MMDELFTWATLATFAGASVATGVITQAIKRAFDRVPTQIVSYVIALIVMLVGTAATGTAEDWMCWAIIPLNALLVSAAANGGYSAICRIAYKKK